MEGTPCQWVGVGSQSAQIAPQGFLMSEIADGNPEAAAGRLGVVADLAQSMGPRFIISQDARDHLGPSRG
jgi:hypothetical protein